MPPKGKKGEPSKKTVEKKKEKIVEDKTFGLKNKKGSKQQKFIQHVNQQVKGQNEKQKRLDESTKQVSKKEEAQKKKEELNMLFRPVDQKIGKGVNPKSVLCAFFKQGTCKKGDKCKFSHDLAMERKSEKRNIYEDKEESMDQWDEQTLQEVVEKKHGQKNKNLPATSIICKYFLDAVEKSKYGWFWECPNGANCHYRHALPPGFVLKKDQKKEEKDDSVSLEEHIETERACLNSQNLTKVTLESFLQWKERKRKEKIAKAKEETDKKKSNFKQGKLLGISGREMFEFNPDLVAGDDAEADDVPIQREDQDDDQDENGEAAEKVAVKELNLESLAALASESDGSGTKRTDAPAAPAATANGPHKPSDEDSKLDVAGALPADPGAADAISAAMAATMNGADTLAADTEIDENLFDGDDIDLVEEELMLDELETLDLED